MAREKLYWDKITGSSNITRTTWVRGKAPISRGGNMYIVFNTGWLYVFFEVPPQIYDAFMKASSKGKFFHQNIKNKYKYNRLGKI